MARGDWQQPIEIGTAPNGDRMYVSVRNDRRRIRLVVLGDGSSFRVVETTKRGGGSHVVAEWTDQAVWGDEADASIGAD
jgi:hypothetical protein